MTASDYLNNFFLGYFPYIALSVFICGFFYRVSRRNNTIQATSSQFVKKDKSLIWGSMLFHFAIIFVFLGHIFGLLMPEWMYTWLMSNETKMILAIIMGSISGIIALIGVAILAVRRFTDKRVIATSKPQDFFIVALILLQIALGLWCTYITSHSSLENYMSMDHWAQGIAILKPDSWKYIIDANFIYKLHIVNGFLIFLIFPFTKLMHMVVVPINYLLDYFRK